MSGKDFFELLPGARAVPVEELARQQGVFPVRSAEAMRAELWDSDEELDAFLTDVRASRQADVG